MPLAPIATFFAGSLLSLLLPVLLLIALVVWYWLFSVRVPETTAIPERVTAPAATDPTANPAPAAGNPAASPAPSAPSETSPPAHGV